MGIHEGFVEIYHGIWGSWGAVVDSHFGANEARTVCNQLGFKGGAVEYYDGDAPFRLYFYESHDDIFAWTNSVDCDGSEGRLTDCNIVFQAYEVPAEALNGVVCDVDGSSIYRGKIRLVDGEDFTHGRVEIYLENKWGTICNDDDFKYEEGYVVCRSLGFPDVESYGKESIPSGIDNIYLEHLDCDGSESSVLYCQARQIHNYNCGNSGEVVVRCSRPADENDGPGNELIAGIAGGTFAGIFVISLVIKSFKKSNASSRRTTAGEPTNQATDITVHKYVNPQGVQQPFQPAHDPTGSQPHSGSYPASASYGMQGMPHLGGHSGPAGGGYSQGYPGAPVVPQEQLTSTATYHLATPSSGSPAHQGLGLPPQASMRPVSPGLVNPPAPSHGIASYGVSADGSPPVYTVQPAAPPQVYTITQQTKHP
ncbi:soluble scavenger receptor cysteine-rich domain-containing protein SSC5D-like [Lytechinus variegatus]|uniref:soluble scavenger receptor cysteine-rich domain-containing protein SSC5D-like n=1 Tax=Lytechinus variegatus TaxID=7654 RepID=UPI001BB1B3B1|nr:soluble scavenger receptor cysteine-rich domain-containing protein SSC5D-like [Lytechinus variegatus]